MSLVIPPGFGSASLVFTGAPGTQPYVITCGFNLAAFGGDFVDAADTIGTGYMLVMGATTSAALTLDRVTLAVGQDGAGGSVDSTFAPIAGQRSGSFPPTAMSAICRKSTNDLGRRGRGRMFVPGIVSENEVDEDGSIVTARRAAINTLLVALFTQWTTGQGADDALPPVLLHSTAPTDPTPIIGFTVSDLVGWVRGRIR